MVFDAGLNINIENPNSGCNSIFYKISHIDNRSTNQKDFIFYYY